jgi:hypothetical protein
LIRNGQIKITIILLIKNLIIKKIRTWVSFRLNQIFKQQIYFLGNKLKFYHYGQGKKYQTLIYENDYPLNTCACCELGCTHY